MALSDGIAIGDEDVAALLEDVLSTDPNSAPRQGMGLHLRRWDVLQGVLWAADTAPLSPERRAAIYRLLDIGEQLRGRFDDVFPMARSGDTPVIIAESHQPWYSVDRAAAHRFYWEAYKRYLRSTANWPPESIDGLDVATTLIVERLSDPERVEIYSTKGLVVGYVQSGKTANFTAVAAKGADAGYRLIIILAGTLNILREQAQRRIDKELIGRELIAADTNAGGGHDYEGDRDWERFVRHGALPSSLGSFNWERLTGAADDYQRLRKGIRALEFTQRRLDRRFNDPENLHATPARLIVMKKTPAILKRLNEDLSRLKTALEEVPALIIDDESDQASVNTRRPTRAEEEHRTATNREIIRLLKTLPRAQYVGYTATPFANVFIDPRDADDLFPKDYIIALKRPSGYMGVTDFFDFAEDGSDLADDERPEGFHSKERAFIRDVRGDDRDPGNLPRAIDSFILSGAIKLFRKEHGIRVSTEHHTMLVHRSTRQTDHEDDARLVQELYEGAATGTQAFYDRLHRLWTEDFEPVSEAQMPDGVKPGSFNELRSCIDKCVSLVEAGHPVRIVNGDKKYEGQLPNFDRDPVWGILVGGAKLSRGYTVEGLTISYYRRRVKTADTLMQVGRWFGFRQHYRDLVRLFMGRAEPDGKDRRMDLYAAFGAICRDEEVFRRELMRYSDPSVQRPIRPVQIPPLVPSHLLMPTARNKMYNAEIRYQNLATQWKERVLPADDPDGRRRNAGLFRRVIEQAGGLGQLLELGFKDTGDRSQDVRWRGYAVEVAPRTFVDFLAKYRWIDNRSLMQREIEFLRGQGPQNPGIDRWLILLPQRAENGKRFWLKESRLSVFERARVHSGGFRVFSERRHRLVAGHLAGVEPVAEPSDSLVALTRPRTAVMLCYPTVGTDDTGPKTGEVPDTTITIGFGLFFPPNGIQTPISFGVKDEKRADAVTVDV